MLSTVVAIVLLEIFLFVFVLFSAGNEEVGEWECVIKVVAIEGTKVKI